MPKPLTGTRCPMVRSSECGKADGWHWRTSGSGVILKLWEWAGIYITAAPRFGDSKPRMVDMRWFIILFWRVVIRFRLLPAMMVWISIHISSTLMPKPRRPVPVVTPKTAAAAGMSAGSFRATEHPVAKDKAGKVLRLQDKDPYEYAKAVRVFPEGSLTNLSFKLRPHQKGKGSGDIEVEVLNFKGQRPIRIKIEGSSGMIQANNGLKMKKVASFSAKKWLKFDISVDAVIGVYDLKLNGKTIVSDGVFAEALTFADKPYESKFRVPTVERIEFRTGAYRMTDFSRYGSGENGCLKGGGDLPGASDPVKNAIFDIDDFRTSGFKL